MSSAIPLGRMLHLIDTGGPGGAETVLASLVTALTERGVRSRVVVPEIDWLYDHLKAAGEDVRVRPGRGAVDVGLLLSFVQEIVAFRPDVIHAHLLGAGVYGSIAARITGTPLVVTFHGKPDVDPADRHLGVKARILTRARNRIAYVSEDLREHLESLLDVPSRLGRVVHNGIDFSDPLPGVGLPEVVLGDGTLVIGAVGNLREPKDYPNLLRAAALVRAERPEAVFVVAGSGPPESLARLIDQRDASGLSGGVHFLGFQDDVRAVLSAIDLFVSSSSSEGLPLSTLEAMGMGLPVVLTDCGGPREIVKDGETGLLVPSRNPEALAAGILRMIADREGARRMGAAGKQDVRTRFARARMVDDYLALYREAASGAPGHPSLTSPPPPAVVEIRPG